jgi:hypothetical protein
VYDAGETGVVTLSADTRGQLVGQKAYVADVEYQGDASGEARLALVVDNQPDVQVVPATLALTLIAGKNVKGLIRIIDSRADSIPLPDVEVVPGVAGITALRRSELGNRPGRYEVEIMARDSAALPLGRTQATITVRAVGRPETWSVPVTIEKVPRIRVAPATVYLRRTPDGGAEGSFVVTDREGEDVVISGVEVAGEGFGVAYPRGKGAQHVVSVRARRAADVQVPVVVRLRMVSPCRQETVVTIAGLSSASSPSLSADQRRQAGR